MSAERRERSFGPIGLITILSLVGIFLSTYLTLVRAGVIGTLICGASSGCEVVQTSRYAVQLGIPVSVWGIIGYGALMAVGVVVLHTGSQKARRLLYTLAAMAVATSAYLSALEAFVIHAWCRWCIVSALLSLAIGVLAALDMRARPRATGES